MDKLEHLTRLLPPPVAELTKPPWGQSKVDSGIEFPSDYRAFVDIYGGGEIGVPGSLNFEVYAPSLAARRPGGWVGFNGYLQWHVADIADMFQGWDSDDWGGIVYSMYPEPGGLLTWGENQQGDMFWWLTEGSDPDSWPVVMWERAPATTKRFDCGMVELLDSMVSGKVPSPAWMHSPHARWTMKSDWLHRGLRVSAGPAI